MKHEDFRNEFCLLKLDEERPHLTEVIDLFGSAGVWAPTVDSLAHHWTVLIYELRKPMNPSSMKADLN